MLKVLDNLLFPKFCEGCGKLKNKICSNCAIQIPVNQTQSCLICGHATTLGFTHKVCAFSFAPIQTYSLFKYEGLIKKMIRKGKYKGVYTLYDEIIKLYNQKSNYLKKFQNSILVPIPITKKRLQKRGFNQSEKICNYLTQTIPNTKTLNLLERIKETAPQYSLSREDRLINMQSSFALKSNAHISSQNIVIVDDILTTGATMREACKVLKKAKSVKCLTLSADFTY